MQVRERSGKIPSTTPLVERVDFWDELLVGKTSGDAVKVEWDALAGVGDTPALGKTRSVKTGVRLGSTGRRPYLHQSKISTPKTRNQPVVKLVADHRFQNLCSEEETIL